MLERSPRTLPHSTVRLGIITVVMGTSFHLVANSITRRLLLIGYQLHLTVRENPVMKNLEPSTLVGAASEKSSYTHYISCGRGLLHLCFKKINSFYNIYDKQLNPDTLVMQKVTDNTKYKIQNTYTHTKKINK